MKQSAGERFAQVLLALLKAGCFLTLFLGAQVLVMLPDVITFIAQVVMGDGAVDKQGMIELLDQRAVLYTLIANLIVLTVVLAFYLIRRKKLSQALWLRRVDAPTLWAGAALAPALYLAVTVMLMAIPESWLESYSEASSGITSGGFVSFLGVAVAAPVVEELIFRGLIMTRLSQAMPGWLAVMLSAAIFGACHGHPVWFSYAFVIGACFGWIDMRVGSIWPSILAHVVFNTIGQLFGLLPDSDGAALAALGALLVVAIVAPILDRKAIAALFRRRPKETASQALPAEPGVNDFDPWE